MGPTPGAWCLHRERRELQIQRHRHTEKADGDRQRLGACGHSPGTLSPQKLEEAPSPGAPGGSTACRHLLLPFRLRNWERAHFCCLKPLVYGGFSRQPQDSSENIEITPCLMLPPSLTWECVQVPRNRPHVAHSMLPGAVRERHLSLSCPATGSHVGALWPVKKLGDDVSCAPRPGFTSRSCPLLPRVLCDLGHHHQLEPRGLVSPTVGGCPLRAGL